MKNNALDVREYESRPGTGYSGESVTPESIRARLYVSMGCVTGTGPRAVAALAAHIYIGGIEASIRSIDPEFVKTIGDLAARKSWDAMEIAIWGRIIAKSTPAEIAGAVQYAYQEGVVAGRDVLQREFRGLLGIAR